MIIIMMMMMIGMLIGMMISMMIMMIIVFMNHLSTLGIEHIMERLLPTLITKVHLYILFQIDSHKYRAYLTK